MSFNHTVNLVCTAGAGFSQNFYLTNPDKTPMDITGCKITGGFAKHPGAVNAVCTTSEEVVWNSVSFTGTIADGVGGVYNLSLNPEDTRGMEQGKYVYSAVMEDVNGSTNRVVHGILFIDFAVHVNK